MTTEVVKYEQVKDRIITLRGVPVLLDADVAQLYGVETKRVNEAVKNNPDKFTGRDTGLKIVLFDGDDSMTGKFVDIKISEAHAFALYGEAVK